jgi:hypothetical protein
LESRFSECEGSFLGGISLPIYKWKEGLSSDFF